MTVVVKSKKVPAEVRRLLKQEMGSMSRDVELVDYAFIEPDVVVVTYKPAPTHEPRTGTLHQTRVVVGIGGRGRTSLIIESHWTK